MNSINNVDDIRKMKELHFHKNHLFINGDFGYYRNHAEVLLDKNDRHYIHPDHRVHIFISYDYSALNDGSLAWFVNFCKSQTIKKVIIHVAKSNIDLVKKIKKQLRYRKNWKLIIEKDETKTEFEYCSRGEYIIHNNELHLVVYYIEIIYNKSSNQYNYFI